MSTSPEAARQCRSLGTTVARSPAWHKVNRAGAAVACDEWNIPEGVRWANAYLKVASPQVLAS